MARTSGLLDRPCLLKVSSLSGEGPSAGTGDLGGDLESRLSGDI